MLWVPKTNVKTDEYLHIRSFTGFFSLFFFLFFFFFFILAYVRGGILDLLSSHKQFFFMTRVAFNKQTLPLHNDTCDNIKINFENVKMTDSRLIRR